MNTPAPSQLAEPGSSSRAFAWFLLLGAACFVLRTAAGLLIGPPPAAGTEILAWIDRSRLLMMLANEALGIGAALLMIGLFAVQRTFAAVAPARTTAGSVLLFAASMLCLVLAVLQGRFVYPIHGLSLTSPDDAALLASVYFGGYHMVALLQAAAMVSWSLLFVRLTRWRTLGYLGLVIALGGVLSSYPDLIGAAAVFALETAVAGWLIALALRLLSSSGDPDLVKSDLKAGTLR